MSTAKASIPSAVSITVLANLFGNFCRNLFRDLDWNLDTLLRRHRMARLLGHLDWPLNWHLAALLPWYVHTLLVWHLHRHLMTLLFWHLMARFNGFLHRLLDWHTVAFWDTVALLMISVAWTLLLVTTFLLVACSITRLVACATCLFIGGGTLLLVLRSISVLALLLICRYTLVLVLSLVRGLVRGRAFLLVTGAALGLISCLIGGLVHGLVNRPAFWSVPMVRQGAGWTLPCQPGGRHKLGGGKVRDNLLYGKAYNQVSSCKSHICRTKESLSKLDDRLKLVQF